MKSNLDWSKFSPLFGTWSDKIKPFFDEGGFDEIYKHLKFHSRRGKRILPLSSDTFRCFIETPYDELKVVICGISPYHILRKGDPVADGMLLSCSSTNYIQGALDQFYNGIEEDLYNGLNMHYIKNLNMSYLYNQGVLGLNAALTTELYKAGNHLEIWEPFMKYLFEEVINQTGVPIVFLGKEAAKLEKYTAPFTWIFKLSHPASASYNNTDWHTDNTFKSLNKILKDSNGYEINWLDGAQVVEDVAIDDDEVPF